MSAPLVSVVVATYDSSHLLRYALASVLLSELEDFEVLVVGDHCTDDTEEVVAAFGDERIRFTNLERNSGQQAKPNNTGVAAARGEYLAFLNQDDLYLPDHLSANLARIRATGADLVCSAYPVIPPEQLEEGRGGDLQVIAAGFEPSGSFSPRTFHVASSWFLRREAALAVGPWKLEDDTWVTPSQEWLFRAWRSGRRIHCTREMSTVAIYSGLRKDAYRKRDTSEHELVFQSVVATDRLRAKTIEAAQAWIDARLAHKARRRPWPQALSKGLRDLRGAALDRVLVGLGIHPNTPRTMRQWGVRRGSYIRRQKRFTG